MNGHPDLWNQLVQLRSEDLHREAERYRARRRGRSPRRPRPGGNDPIER